MKKKFRDQKIDRISRLRQVKAMQDSLRAVVMHVLYVVSIAALLWKIRENRNHGFDDVNSEKSSCEMPRLAFDCDAFSERERTHMQFKFAEKISFRERPKTATVRYSN